jgi:hypothetical protein
LQVPYAHSVGRLSYLRHREPNCTVSSRAFAKANGI